jgi:hypothetical protein
LRVTSPQTIILSDETGEGSEGSLERTKDLKSFIIYPKDSENLGLLDLQIKCEFASDKYDKFEGTFTIWDDEIVNYVPRHYSSTVNIVGVRKK